MSVSVIPSSEARKGHAVQAPLRHLHGESISVIVPARQAWPPPAVLGQLRQNGGQGCSEVLVAVGQCPSEQRNRAVEEVEGEIVGFVDDDVIPAADWTQRLAEWYANPRVVGVCGPNLAPPDESRLVPRAVDAVLTSTFGVFGKRSKYASARLANAADDELILCNASFRRDFFLEVGGFRPDLYPNEENEFLERAQGQLGDRWIIYDPRLVVYRARPATVWEHLRTIFGYGVGRVNQLLTAPSPCSLVNLLPSVALVVGMLFIGLGLFWPLLLAPHALYATALAVTTLQSCRRRSWKLSPLLLFLIPGTHVAYALGQMSALLRAQRHSRRVNLDTSHIDVHRISLGPTESQAGPPRASQRDGNTRAPSQASLGYP